MAGKDADTAFALMELLAENQPTPLSDQCSCHKVDLLTLARLYCEVSATGSVR